MFKLRRSGDGAPPFSNATNAPAYQKVNRSFNFLFQVSLYARRVRPYLSHGGRSDNRARLESRARLARIVLGSGVRHAADCSPVDRKRAGRFGRHPDADADPLRTHHDDDRARFARALHAADSKTRARHSPQMAEGRRLFAPAPRSPSPDHPRHDRQDASPNTGRITVDRRLRRPHAIEILHASMGSLC